MYRFQNILAAVDTRYNEHPAWEQALLLARRTGAQVTVVDVVPDFGWPARLAGVDVRRISEDLRQQKAEQLEKLASAARSEGMTIRTKVLSGKTSVAIINEVKAANHDLVIRTTKGRGSQREGLLGTTSINLLRYCPSPVWLVRPDLPVSNKVITAAVDAGTFDAEHQKLNITVLQVASSLAQILPDSQWHVVYAWMIFGENLLREHMTQDELKQVIAATEADNKRLLAKLLEHAQLSVDDPRVHMLHGDPCYAIPEFLDKLHADLLVIGTVGRSGLAGFFIGNTAERILDRAKCGILAVKPARSAPTGS
jgi:nucleotide-binding universal stress UspA family protein